jgi:DNA-binding XRE family transcriptional regulator
MEITDKILERRLPPPAVRREIRVGAGATQDEVATPCRVNRASVARWELGVREPRGETRIRYAKVLRQLLELQ